MGINDIDHSVKTPTELAMDGKLFEAPREMDKDELLVHVYRFLEAERNRCRVNAQYSQEWWLGRSIGFDNAMRIIEPLVKIIFPELEIRR